MNWLARDGSLDAEDWDALVRVAEQSGDLTGLRTAIARAAVGPFDGQGDAPPPATAFLQFLRYQGARALIPYESTMTSETFEEVPLIGAAWHGWLRQPKESFDYLLAAANGPLTDWDRAIWMLIAYDLRSTTFYRDLLAGAPADAGLRDLLSLSIRSPMPTPPLGEQSAPTGD
jgi:hypothetical protein